MSPFIESWLYPGAPVGTRAHRGNRRWRSVVHGPLADGDVNHLDVYPGPIATASYWSFFVPSAVVPNMLHRFTVPCVVSELPCLGAGTNTLAGLPLPQASFTVPCAASESPRLDAGTPMLAGLSLSQAQFDIRWIIAEPHCLAVGAKPLSGFSLPRAQLVDNVESTLLWWAYTSVCDVVQTLEALARFQAKMAEHLSVEDGDEDSPDDKSDRWLSHQLRFAEQGPVLARDASVVDAEEAYSIDDPRNAMNERRRKHREHSGVGTIDFRNWPTWKNCFEDYAAVSELESASEETQQPDESVYIYYPELAGWQNAAPTPQLQSKKGWYETDLSSACGTRAHQAEDVDKEKRQSQADTSSDGSHTPNMDATSKTLSLLLNAAAEICSPADSLTARLIFARSVQLALQLL
ncbi:hypothetical protein HPB49_026167 [Dermacentor silvarum]|nr:hypothetical protein HPB49_026167 [Dermacentor silvarum]